MSATVVAALTVSALTAGSAQALGAHERANGSVVATCTSITFNYKGFPNANGNTVSELVTVHEATVVTKSFTFNGPEGSDTIPITVPPGSGKVDGKASWNTNGFKSSYDVAWQLNCSFPSYTIQKLQRIQGSGEPFTTAELVGNTGETVEYEVVVKDTGNTDLTFGNFVDKFCTGVAGGPSGPLHPGESATYTCAHTFTANDLSGDYVNQATVTATPPKTQGAAKTQKSNIVVVRFPGNHGRPNGEVLASCTAVTFSFKGFPEANGNTVTEKVFVKGTLVATVVFTFNGSKASNTIPVAVPVGASTVDGLASWNTNGFKGSWDVAWQLYCAATPNFSLEKQQTVEGSGEPFTAAPVAGRSGETIDYRILASNTGNVPLTFESLLDAGCDGGTIAGGPGVSPVQPGASTTFTCSHALTDADATAGFYDNTAAITARPPAGDGSPLTRESNTVEAEVKSKLQ